MQTRHAYGRMVAVVTIPRLAWCAHRRRACDAQGALQFSFDHGCRAWARLAHCDCCGSPGRIEVCNGHGLDFLQVCAMPECAAADWAEFLGEVVVDVPSGEMANSVTDDRAFPRMMADAQIVSDDVDELPRLLRLLAENEARVTCSLVTAEAAHRREFSLKQVSVEGGLLTAGEGLSRFQLGLPAARRLALTRREGRMRLHVAGADDALLLTLSGGQNEQAEFFWKEALHAVFPGP
ncbi:MAG: hypothetical protein ABW223_00040 [Rariglobus sp.]